MNQIPITAIDLTRQGRQKIADAAITPGNLLEQTATGFKVHATASGDSEKIIALANIARAADYTSPYVATETVQSFIALPGDEFYATMSAGASSIAALADLVSAGNGNLKAASAGTSAAVYVAKALETVTNTAGATTAWIKCRAR